MIFWIFLAVVFLVVFISILVDSPELFGSTLLIGFFVGLIGFGLIGTTAYGDFKTVSTTNITNVHAYSNPNGGTVISYTEADTGRVRALDEGGDVAELKFAPEPSTMKKMCRYNSQTWVPWHSKDCKFVVSTPSVDSLK